MSKNWPVFPIIVILSVLPLVALQAQTVEEIDSLERLLPMLKTDKQRYKVLAPLVRYYRIRNTDKTRAYVKQGLALQVPDSPLVYKRVVFYNALAIAMTMLSKHDSAWYYYQVAEKSLLEANDSAALGGLYANIAASAVMESANTRALTYLSKAFLLNEKLKKPAYENAQVYGTIATVYKTMYDYKTSMHYDSLALAVAAGVDNPLVKQTAHTVKGNLAHTLSKLGQYEKAKQIYLDIIPEEEKLGREFFLASNLYAFAIVRSHLAEYAEADALCARAEALLRKINNIEHLSGTLAVHADVRFALKDFDAARRLATEAFALGTTTKHWNAINTASMVLIKLSAMDRALDKMDFYNGQFQTSLDSIIHSDRMAETTALRTRFETDQKERENELLRKDGLLKEARLGTQKVISLSIAIVLALAAVVAAMLYRNYRKQKSLATALTERNVLIEQQKTAIVTANTDLHAALDNLQATQHQLVHSEKMASLGQLTAGIAHEINNPVNFILGGVQGLRTHLQTVLNEAATGGHDFREALDDVKVCISSIEIGAGRTAKIVESLMNFSYVGINTRVQVDLLQHIRSTLTILQAELKDRIEVVEEFGTIPLVTCNIGEINQVLLNIIMNAVQAINGKGTIAVKTGVDTAGDVAISIRDTGHGIPPGVMPRIFDPFYTTRDVGKGTGLGLYISYNIMQQHGGSIRAMSHPKGTEFVITLPVKSVA